MLMTVAAAQHYHTQPPDWLRLLLSSCSLEKSQCVMAQTDVCVWAIGIQLRCSWGFDIRIGNSGAPN
jgi:hypothetical protein